MLRGTTLRTDRLVLRRITRAEVPALVAGLNDYGVSKWLTAVPFPYGAADAETFLRYLDDRGRFDGFGISAGGGPVMGVVGIDKSLGYWLGRRYHGQGFMTEAASAMVRHYFAASAAGALSSGYFDGNRASARVLGKLGFRPAGEEQVTSRAQGSEVTLKRMRLTRADWESRHG